ncbi:MAG: elongation factor G-like protein EF-G2 [Actinomycetes bacterium]
MSGSATGGQAASQIRNVVLVGDTGSGKTSLVEALLAATGAITRLGRVEDGSTVSDSDPIEIRLERSVNLSLAPTSFDGVKINLIDTPGYADFVGDLRAGLRGADAALFVVSATDQLTGATGLLWDECASVGMARAVVLTKLDQQRAAFDDSVARCQQVLDDGVLPLYWPAFESDGHTISGLLGLLSQQLHDYSSGKRNSAPADPALLAAHEQSRDTLIEAIVTGSEDETLLDQYLAGEAIDQDVLIADLELAIARGSFFPLLAVNPITGLGIAELLELVTKAFPAPQEHRAVECTTPDGAAGPTLACDPKGPLLAEVIKTTSAPYVGKVSLVRVFSGTLRPDTLLHVSGHFSPNLGHQDHDVDERVGGLSAPLGKNQNLMAECPAGDICAVAKLARAETGDTLSSVEQPLLMDSWQMPEPMLPVSIVAHTKSDDDKLSRSLARLLAEDPTLRLESKEDTGQLVLWCLGESHADVVLDRLQTKFGVAVETTPLRVSLRETFVGHASGLGRHVKQSGGHGQYGVCEIEVEPLAQGAGFEFVDKVVGGTVPRQFIPSVEKGLRTQMARGVAAGYPLTDIRVTLLGGKAHSVDSSDMAFQSAGALALKDAAAKGEVVFLEPVSEVSVIVPDQYVGQVMTDLSTRRGRLTGTESIGSSRSLIRAEVPEIELTRYVIDLRSMSHGTGRFDRHDLGYQPMPTTVAAKLRDQA